MKTEYFLKNKLGQGTYGEVFLGDVKTNSFFLNDVAIKRIKIKKSNQDTGEDIENVKRELDILSKVQNSSYTVKYYLAETRIEYDNVYLYIVMEKLNEWVSQIPYFSLRKIKSLFINLLNGLSFIHSKGIVHGDIKLENILEKNNILVYSDFGLSCFEPKCDELAGTIKYMDPALYITYEGMLDIKYEKEKMSYDSDIYSLGCVFYYMLMNEDYFDLVDPCDTYDEYFDLYNRRINNLEKKYRFHIYDKSEQTIEAPLGSNRTIDAPSGSEMKFPNRASKLFRNDLDKYYNIVTILNIVKEMLYPISIIDNTNPYNRIKPTAKQLSDKLVYLMR